MSEQKYDLLISHSQIQVRAYDFDESMCQWGKENLEQGAILHESYVVFDPLPDDTFGAQIIINFCDKFDMDKNIQRGIVTPFYIPKDSRLVVSSASESFYIDLNYSFGMHALYYEICENDEVYYRLSFLKSSSKKSAYYLIDDPWGGVAGKPLFFGKK